MKDLELIENMSSDISEQDIKRHGIKGLSVMTMDNDESTICMNIRYSNGNSDTIRSVPEMVNFLDSLKRD